MIFYVRYSYVVHIVVDSDSLMKNLPSRQETSQRLGSSRDMFYVILHKAVAAARRHIGQDYCPFTPNFFAHYIRVKLIELLKVMPDVIVEEVSNDGVMFVLKGMRFWCLKAQDGKVPSPGKSDHRLDFSKQRGRSIPTQLALLDEALTPQPVKVSLVDINLYLIWDYTPIRELDFVHIVCPRDATTREVYIEWTDLIKKPLALGNDFAASQSEIGEHDDLTFTLRDDTPKEEFDEGAR